MATMNATLWQGQKRLCRLCTKILSTGPNNKYVESVSGHWMTSIFGRRAETIVKTQKQNPKKHHEVNEQYSIDWYKNLNACWNRKKWGMFWNWDHHEKTIAQSMKPTRFTTRWEDTSHHWVLDAPLLVKRPVIESSNTWMQTIMRNNQGLRSKSRSVRDGKPTTRAQTAEWDRDDWYGFPGRAGIKVIPRPVGKGFL